MRIHLLAAVLLCCIPSSLWAQTAPDPRWTLGATGGFGRTWEDEGSIGSGWLIGGYVDRRLAQHLDLEVAADLLKNDRRDRFQADGHTTYVSVQLIPRFGSRARNAFVMGGPTFAFYEGTTGFDDGSFRNEHSSTTFGWMFGGGFSFRTSRSLEITPLVRMTLMNVDSGSDPWSSITGGLRIGFGR